MKNIASSAGRWLDVAPSRFPGWVADFAERHGGDAEGAALTVVLASGGQGGLGGRAVPPLENVIYTASDGAVAECHPPFPPVGGLAAADPAACAEAIAAHAMTPRTVGVLLVRLGGYAAGVFTGSPPSLAASKTGARPVHGRSAAGGWSQHRFARRREKQASEALQAAAGAAAMVFGSWEEGGRGLDAVVLGGDKRAVAELRADPRLLSYFELATDRFLTVPDPKLAVLKDVPRRYLAVRIWLTEPAT